MTQDKDQPTDVKQTLPQQERSGFMQHCTIHRPDVYRYLGFQGNNVDEVTQNQVEEMATLLESVTAVRYTSKVFPLEEGSTFLQGTTLTLQGQQVALLLKESHHCILMAITIGHKVDQKIRELQIRDMANAVVFDACASSLVEEYCNQLEKNLLEEHPKQFFTDRFSPGYGDLPLDTQLPLCTILQTQKTMGMSLSQTHLMSPKKSITALVGVSDTPQPMRIKGCGYCVMRGQCAYRKGGKTCGTSAT